MFILLFTFLFTWKVAGGLKLKLKFRLEIEFEKLGGFQVDFIVDPLYPTGELQLIKIKPSTIVDLRRAK